MSRATNHPSPADDSAADASAEAHAYRHLSEAISLKDTVASMRGDSPPDPSGERNAFIAAAINAGG